MRQENLANIRIFILTFLLGIGICFIPAVKNRLSGVADQFDKRPPVNILFIGNSRTFYHDMPFMVRDIADSAGDPKKYIITMHAPGGMKLKDHWNNPEVMQLLRQKWDYVVIQGASDEQLDDAANSEFDFYGQQLISMAKASGARPVLFLSWRYDDDSHHYAQLGGAMQASYAQLALETGVGVVNVGIVWEKLRGVRPDIQLYEDGNHPTIYGSYLTALMFYKYFSDGDVGKVKYIPSGVSAKDAVDIIQAVRNGAY